MSTKILIADDHKLMREGVRSLIVEHVDLSVIGEAEDGVSAVRMAAELSPDVVLMDVTMPGLSGIEATRRIVANGARCKVIALSMNVEKRIVLNMLAAGASGYLVKDCAFEELIHAISVVASSNDIYLSPKITGVVLNDMVNSEADSAGIESAGLTLREREVLRLFAEGKNTKEVAFLLACSVKSVEYYRKQIMKKLRVTNIADLVRFAIREGLAPL
jgi:DNA-binding NarL/FixJ family response regulator